MDLIWRKKLHFNLWVTNWSSFFELNWRLILAKEKIDYILEWMPDNEEWIITDWSSFWISFMNQKTWLKVVQTILSTNRDIWKLIFEDGWDVTDFSYKIEDY